MPTPNNMHLNRYQDEYSSLGTSGEHETRD